MSQQVTNQKGAFMWSAGGWFGSQVGGTLWMLLVGIGLGFQDIRPAAALIAAFILCNVIGTWLWLKRDVIAAYPAIQILLGAIGICALASILTVDALGYIPPGARFHSYWWLIFVPVLMLMFHFREKSARRQQAR